MTSRPLPTPHVLGAGALTAARQAQVRELAASAEQVDGVEALGEQTLLALGSADAAVLHVLLEGDEPGTPLLGYAQVDLHGDPPGAELVIAPAARRAGLGRALLTAVRVATTRAGHPTPAVWAHGDLPGARALAREAGLTGGRTLLRMARDLSGDADAPTLPEGTVLRPFVAGQDEEAVLAVNERAFSWHPEQGRMDLSDLRARQAEAWFDPEDLLLLERDGALLGFVWLKVEPGADEGELYVLAVDPRAQGQGLGRVLTAVTLTRLAGRGLRRVVLYTEADNVAAVGTYRAAGFTQDRIDVQYR